MRDKRSEGCPLTVRIQGEDTMQIIKGIALLVALTLLSLSIASAQVVRVRVRGEVVSLAGNELTLKSPGGDTVKVKLADKLAVVALTKGTHATVKTGSYIAVSSTKGPGDTQVATDVMVILEASRGMLEGQYKWDQGEDSMMTNANISGEVKMTNGTELTLTPKGQSTKILVPAGAAIVQQEVADPSLIVPGARMFFGAVKAQDGSLSTDSVYVGKGCAPSQAWVPCK
jgi:hypothetical protein